MKKIFLFLLLIPCFIQAQTWTTVYGRWEYEYLRSAHAININTTGIPPSTYNDGLVLENKTPVNVSLPYQFSPGIHLIAHVFNSSTDKKVEWRMYVKPGPAGMSFNADLVIESSFDGVTWTEKMRLNSNGSILTLPANLVIGSGAGPFTTITNGGISGPSLGASVSLSLTNTDVSATATVTSPITTCTSGTFTLTLPSISSNSLVYYIVNLGTGTITVASGGAYNITNGLVSATTWTLTQGKFLQVVSNFNGTAKYQVFGYN